MGLPLQEILNGQKSCQKLNFFTLILENISGFNLLFSFRKIEPINNEVLKTSLARLITSTCKENILHTLRLTKILQKKIRTFEINKYVSKYASIKPLRDFLLTYQRSLKTLLKKIILLELLLKAEILVA